MANIPTYLLSSWNIAHRKAAAARYRVHVLRDPEAHRVYQFSFLPCYHPPYFYIFDFSGCLAVCNLFLYGDAQAPTMQGRL